VITFYAVPLDDGTGFVIHKCAHCHHHHVVDGTGPRWLRCGVQVLIKSTEDRRNVTTTQTGE
jgi:hypothetical protein